MPKVALFIPCFVDQLSPQVGMDMAQVLRRIGCQLHFSVEQTCCGQPAFNTGYWKDARPLAERFVRVFRGADAIVCPSGSCTTQDAPELREKSSALHDRKDIRWSSEGAPQRP